MERSELIRLGDGLESSAATLEIAGRAHGTDWTTDLIAQTLEEGQWMGSFTEGAMSDDIRASFTGALRTP